MSCEGFCLRRVAKDVVWVRWSDAGVDAGAEGVVVVVVVVSSEGLWWPWWAGFFFFFSWCMEGVGVYGGGLRLA